MYLHPHLTVRITPIYVLDSATLMYAGSRTRHTLHAHRRGWFRMIDKRTVMDDDGAERHVFDYKGESRVAYDMVIFKNDPDDDSLIHCVAYKGEDIAYQTTFKQREMSFDPISSIGRGQTTEMWGVSDQQDAEVPRDIAIGLNVLGFAPVPSGEWWLDE